MEFSTASHPRQFWIECERQLFSMVGMEPERYEQIITAIRCVSEVLKKFATPEALGTAWETAPALFQEASENFGFPTHLLPVEKVSGAAFAMRERQITEENQRSYFLLAINDAKASGEEWVTLNETGNIDHGLMDPYRCTEMNVKNGLAIVSATRMDGSGAKTLYVLSVVKLDCQNGQLVDAEPGVEDWLECASADEFRGAREKLREKVIAFES